MPRPPAPIADLDAATASGIHGVLCDIDDTLTWEGELVPAAYHALAAARDAGLSVLPITGRPAGWADQIARLWPVDGVVGENGGLWFWMQDGRMHRRYVQEEPVRVAHRRRLATLATRILAAVPGCAISADQPWRELDLAVDFCEDVPPLDEAAIDHIVALFHEAGATCKVSSIHVNGWYGEFDKLSGCRALVADRWGRPLDEELSRWIYVGDSANDEPMFAHFPNTVGVANVRRFLPRMQAWPTWITDQPGGHGFAQAIHHLLDLRGG